MDFANLDAFSLIVFAVGVSVRAVAFFGKAHPTDENPRARAVVAGVVTEDVSMTGLEGAVAQGVCDVVKLLVDQHELAEPRSKPVVTFLDAVGPVESGLAVRASLLSCWRLGRRVVDCQFGTLQLRVRPLGSLCRCGGGARRWRGGAGCADRC